MSKFTNARSKISNALFSDFGEQGILIKKSNSSQHEIYIMKQEKTFNAGGKLLTTSSSIRIMSKVKPELYDSVTIEDKTFKIKASPKLVANNIYEISVD